MVSSDVRRTVQSGGTAVAVNGLPLTTEARPAETWTKVKTVHALQLEGLRRGRLATLACVIR